MKISFITTVFNEEKTLRKFLDSLLLQTKLPNEIIIVDGGSTDKTVDRIKNYESRIKGKRIKFKVIIKKGNRSVGRNEAIRNATGDVIVCTDAGNILDKDWIKNITKPFVSQKSSSSVDVVAGYYKGKAKNIFQKCLIPYVLVMPNKVNPDEFLPATRSMAFTKQIWKKAGGFDERLSHNEDYAFAQKLKEKKAKIIFAKDAIVNWIPRNTFKEAFVMFFRFAFGDAEAGIWRTSVLLLFARYFLGLYFIFLSLLYKSVVPLAIIATAFVAYIFWSIKKNYHYVNQKQAKIILPLLQFTADIAVLSGTLMGAWKRLVRFNYLSYISNNKFLFFIIGAYTLITLLTLTWGIPNEQHPFPYHMDEWHQLLAVANTFRYGTPNVFGSANGTILEFVLSGFYLIPFTLFQIVNPFELQIDNWVMRERVFAILRLQTIGWGILSLFVLYKITAMIKISKSLTLFLFTFTPVWLILSGHFKYDIALMFWILLSYLFFFQFIQKPTNKNFILAAIPPALAMSVKISALPLLLLYGLLYFFFHPEWKRSFRYLIIGVSLFIALVLLFGVPDTIFGKGNVLLYLYENLVLIPGSTATFALHENVYQYLYLHVYPIIFGHGLMALFGVSLAIFLFLIIKQGIKKSFKKYSIEIFILISIGVFLLSLLTQQVWGTGNRALVLLPLFVLFSSCVMRYALKMQSLRRGIIGFMVVAFAIQLFVSFAWVHTKLTEAPQEQASSWITASIKQGKTIGLEQIPIYQGVPDILQKEFYFNDYGIGAANSYQYTIVDSRSKNLPEVIVLTNLEINEYVIRENPQKLLRERMEKEGYREIVRFSPDLRYSDVFANHADYFFSGLVAFPLSIAVFEK